MTSINENYDKLPAGYLFPEIAKRTRQFQEAHPGVQVMRLGIGNTTEPLTPSVIRALHSGVDKLADVSTYTGYGDEQGDTRLRKALAEHYSKRGVSIDSSEVFISDGAKPDTANIQSIFGLENIVAIQDPVYPVYVDTNIIAGRGGRLFQGKYTRLHYMPCTEENGFFPDIPAEKRVSSSSPNLIYLCSPNNPTGSVATKEQLGKFVDYARKHKSIILFDAAYSMFISDPELPRSIYEIEGAKECAIEISSFSKWAGFTGVRLGWTVVPNDLISNNATPGKINSLWNRRQTTFFNGASNIAQEGGLTVLTEQGSKECQGLVDYYMENARMIRQGMEEKGLKIFGGVNAPYIWAETPNGMNSWEFFDKLLNEANVVGTPGSGFGPQGEGYFRLSAFGHRENVERAIKSIQNNLRM